MSNLSYYDYDSVLWLWNLCKQGYNGQALSDNAVAGIFGNLYEESRCCPYCTEGWEWDYPKFWQLTCDMVRPTTTADEFARQTYRYGTKKGYSLAQWTEYSRKVAYWNYSFGTKDHNYMGDMERDGNYLMKDLFQNTDTIVVPGARNYWSSQGKTTWQWLTTPGVSIDDATKAVLYLFERPGESIDSEAGAIAQGNRRINYGNLAYQDFTGQTPPPTPTPDPPPPTPTPTPGSPNIPVWLMFKLNGRIQ